MNENRTLEITEELAIGCWGEAWQKFMLENFPAEAAELQRSARWSDLARKVDNEAWKLRQLLRSLYAKARALSILWKR